MTLIARVTGLSKATYENNAGSNQQPLRKRCSGLGCERQGEETDTLPHLCTRNSGNQHVYEPVLK